MASIPPTSATQLDVWSANYVAKVVATPTAFGLVTSDATQAQTLYTAFHDLKVICDEPDTRTRGNIASRDVALNALLACLRRQLKQIAVHPGLTPQQRIEFGMRSVDPEPSPKPIPTTRPMLSIDPDGYLRIEDEMETSRRAKPLGVAGALIFVKVDGPAPTSFDDAKFSMVATRTRTRLPLPPGSKGKTLYALARWFNTKGELGPLSPVAETVIAA